MRFLQRCSTNTKCYLHLTVVKRCRCSPKPFENHSTASDHPSVRTDANKESPEVLLYTSHVTASKTQLILLSFHDTYSLHLNIAVGLESQLLYDILFAVLE